MNRLLIIFIHTSCLTILNAEPQYDFGQQYFQMQQMSGMPSISGMLQMPVMSQMQSLPEMPSVSYFSSYGSNPSSFHETNSRRSRHHKHKRSRKESSEDEYDYSSDVSSECRCSCNKCDKPKPCCLPICEQCNMVGANQGNVMLVPYAYPIFLTHPPDKQEAPDIQVTTPSSTTTVKERNDNNNKSNQDVGVIRTILNKEQHDKNRDTTNNDLDDVDMKLMKIIRMVQSATIENNKMISSVETQTTTLRTTTTTTLETTTATTTTPVTTTTTTTTTTPITTTSTTTARVTTSTTTKTSPSAKKTKKTKQNNKKASTTTTLTKITTPETITTETTPESAEITITITDSPVTQQFGLGSTAAYSLVNKDMLHKTERLQNKHYKYILTSRRQMKDNYLSKYGVVPIPDDVAERLLQKIRSLKSKSIKSRTVTPETFFPEELRHRQHLPLHARIGRYQDNIEI